MQLSDLPDNILLIILRKCSSSIWNNVAVFKRNLPLLSVCQKWRALAAPMVYNHVFVCYSDVKLDERGRPLRERSGSKYKGEEFRTNLGLIAAAGYKDMVKCADITVYCSDSPIAGLTRVIEGMHELAGEWKNVSKLEIVMEPTTLRHDYSDLIMADYEDDIRRTGNALAALMPELRQLRFGGECSCPVVAAICSHLAGFYTEQLQVLRSQYPIVIPSGRRYKCLKEASMSGENQSYYSFPSMDTAELETMWLYNAPTNHSWTQFSTDEGSSNIEFIKLKHLRVGYRASYEENGVVVPHRDGHPWSLYFPNLESINIGCSVSTCPLLEYMVLPPRMKEITIEMKLEHFQRYEDVRLPVANKVALKVDRFSRGEPSGLVVINRMLDSVRGSDNVELEIMSSEISIFPSSITSTAITRLLIGGPTGVDTMFELLQRLPNLVGLVVHKLDMDSVQTDISVPEAGDHTPIEPYNAMLTVMAINYKYDNHLPDLAAAIAKHLLLKIPTLTKFFAYQTPVQPVLDFAETYSQQYPHLSSIKFRLRDDIQSARSNCMMQALY